MGFLVAISCKLLRVSESHRWYPTVNEAGYVPQTHQKEASLVIRALAVLTI